MLSDVKFTVYIFVKARLMTLKIHHKRQYLDYNEGNVRFYLNKF